MGAVLKAREEVLGRARPFSWLDTREEARRLLAAARSEADGILAAARSRAEDILAEGGRAAADSRALAEAEGRRAGQEAGMVEARSVFQTRLESELSQARAALEGVVAALRTVPERFAARAEGQTVALAVTVAELLVRRELRTDPALVAGNVRAALEAIAASGRVILRLHPEDRLLLEERLPEVLRGLADPGRIEVVADPGVSRGGCLASAEGASADATVARQVAEVRLALLGEEPS